MVNYVMIYNLEDDLCQTEFMKKFRKKYPDTHIEDNNGITYFGFRGGKVPEVQDEIYAILQNLNINQSDHVALYYKRPSEKDVIKRLMIIGSDSLVESQTNKVSDKLFEGTLNELLEYDYVAERQQ